jgi:hypothetical protein
MSSKEFQIRVIYISFSDDVLVSSYQGICPYFNGVSTNKSLEGAVTAHLKVLITLLFVCKVKGENP